MKKALFILVLILISAVLLGFWEVTPNTKLKLYTMVQKKWMRIRTSKPSTFLDKTVLKQKIAKGPPIWMQQQIAEDLSQLSNITEEYLDKCFTTNSNKHNRLVRIKIKNNALTIIPQDQSLKELKSYQIIHNVLEFLARNNYLPDTDFILSLQDYVVPEQTDAPLPIFTFAKDTSVAIEKHLILVPDWMNLRSRAELMSRIQYANSLYPWDKKQSYLFWRGSVADSTGFRRALVAMTDTYPNLIDARFSQNNPELYVSEENHVPFRYQATIDGSRGTWERVVWQLQSNCLVFKHNSNHVQWFYKGIIPNVHYIPIQDEKSLLSKMAWAEKNPDEANKIITQAMAFANEYLTLEDMYYYWIVVLQAYSQKLS